MNKKAEKTIFGFRLTDLLGIVIMVVPFLISMMSFNVTKRVIPIVPWITKTEHVDINPGFVTGILSILFYGALILRYGIFKRNTVMEAVISVIRVFLNCWVIASLLTVIVDAGDSVLGFMSFRLNTNSLLLIAVLFTWVGMKTLAGYSWILFFFAGIGRLQTIDIAMGKMGAVFVLTFAASMLLQIENYVHIEEIANDFRASSRAYSRGVKDNVKAAGNDANQRVSAATEFAKDTIRRMP